MDWLSNVFIAHRGLHSNDSKTPENSLKAFLKAIQGGYAIELDVRLSRDQQLVVFHDDNLKRMCDKEGTVDSFDLDELKKFTLLNSEERIPTLVEVFELVKGQTPILIEIKDSKKAGILESILLRELERYNGEIAVQSFNPFSIRWFKKNAPNVLRGQLSSSFKDEKMPVIQKTILKYMIFDFLTKPNFIAYEKFDISKDFLQRRRNRGKVLLCWTIKSLNERSRVLNYCDNIIFEGFLPK